jgi:hypothetical protein
MSVRRIFEMDRFGDSSNLEVVENFFTLEPLEDFV